MFVDALHHSALEKRLQVRIISEITQQCLKSRELLYPPKENFVLERVYLQKFPQSTINFFRIFKAILQERPHIVHFYWPAPAFYWPAFWPGFRFFGEPFLILLLILRLLSIRVLVTIHGMPRWLPQFIEKVAFERSRIKIIAKAVKTYFFTLMFILCHLANIILIGVVLEGSGTTKQFAKCYKISESRIGEEPHGCLEIKRSKDPKTVQRIKRKLGISGKKVILCFGFIRPEKGYEYAIKGIHEIIQKDRNVALIIAGKAKSRRDMRYLKGLKSLAKKLNLKGHVIFDNRFIPSEEIIDYYSISEVLLLPYTAEPIGFSGPLLLSISFGVPVVATSSGDHMLGLEKLVKLIPPKNVKALEQAINEILSSITLRNEIKAKLRSHATRYSWPKVAKRIVKAYASMQHHQKR
jgi:glycosyltransferase involved in cell wall biosynthesis